MSAAVRMDQITISMIGPPRLKRHHPKLTLGKGRVVPVVGLLHLRVGNCTSRRCGDLFRSDEHPSGLCRAGIRTRGSE